jgi:hypothetical protein
MSNMTTDTEAPMMTSTLVATVCALKPMRVRQLPDGRIELRIDDSSAIHLSPASAAALYADLGAVIG